MKKSGKIALGIIIGIVAAVIAVIFLIVHAVLGFLGYKNPVERYYLKLKTDIKEVKIDRKLKEDREKRDD